MEKPPTNSEAIRCVRYFDEELGCARCGWDHGLWARLEQVMRSPKFANRHVFDAMLAVTLRANGVSEFHTRNTRDFVDFGFERLVNPIDGD